jgi:YHS domain-containing protein
MDSDVKNLVGRIEAEIAKGKANVEKLRAEKVGEHKGREERLAQFEKACESLKEVWKPRLEALQKSFGDKVKVAPNTTAGRRQAVFAFTSELARITLTFTATTDTDVRNLVLNYTLEILPVLMSFPDSAKLEQPFDKVDPKSIGAWIDDRIVEFVKTYMSVHENEFYLKGHMVEDPVVKVRFPKFAAAATLEKDGKTIYFISNETKQEFEAKQGKGAAEPKETKTKKK